jgi:putative aldouronate transport system substrate-binding protein
MRKLAVLLLSFAVVAGVFASGETESGTGGAGAAPTTLEVMIFDRGNVPAEYGTATDNVWTEWISEQMQEAHNIDVSFVGVPRAQERDRLNTLMAAGDAPDIIFTYSMDLYYSYASQGGLTDLTDLIDQYGPNLRSLIGEDSLEFGQVGDEQLMVPAVRSFQGIFVDWIRQDWLDAVGLPMPTTTDEWYDALVTIRDEDPGNVGDNFVGYWLDANAVRLGPLFRQNLMNSFVTEMTEEEWYTLPDLAKPGFKEGVRFLNKLYHEGLINQDFALATTKEPFREAVANGYVASVTDTYWQLFQGEAVNTLVESDPDAFYAAAPMFDNYAGEYPREMYLPIDMILMVPSFSENAVEAVKYLDWLSLPEVNEYLWWGEEGEHHYVAEDGYRVQLPVEERRDEAEMPFLNNWDMSLVRRNAFYDWSTPEGMETGLEAAVHGLREEGRDAEADMRKMGQQVSLVDGFTPPFFGQPIEAEGRYGSVLVDKHMETIIRSVMADPAEFDSVYDAGLEEYMNAGGREVIEEKQQVYRELIAD